MENCHKVIKWPEREEYATIVANFDEMSAVICLTLVLNKNYVSHS